MQLCWIKDGHLLIKQGIVTLCIFSITYFDFFCFCENSGITVGHFLRCSAAVVDVIPVCLNVWLLIYSFSLLTYLHPVTWRVIILYTINYNIVRLVSGFQMWYHTFVRYYFILYYLCPSKWNGTYHNLCLILIHYSWQNFPAWQKLGWYLQLFEIENI